MIHPSLLRKLLFHPLAAPVIVALLLLDLWMSGPPEGFDRGPSAYSRVWPARFRYEDWPLSCDAFYYPPRSEERGEHPHVWRLVKNPWLGNIMSAGSMTIEHKGSQAAEGLWAVTRLRVHHAVSVSRAHFSRAKPTPAEIAAARHLFVRDFLGPASGLPQTALEQIETTGYSDDRIIWTGYLHNAAAAILFLCLPFSLFGMARFLVIPHLHASRRRRGLCPACGYDLRGLTPESLCPECGSQPVLRASNADIAPKPAAPDPE